MTVYSGYRRISRGDAFFMRDVMEFNFKTSVKDEMSNAHPLLDQYNSWNETNK